MEPKKIKRIMESMFSYDYLGDTLGELRADLENEELKQKLYQILLAAVQGKIGDAAEQSLLEEICMTRVEQFIASAKATRGTGCGA